MFRRLSAAALCLIVCIFPVAAAVDAEAGEGNSSVVYHAHANEGAKIALTFDDGPHPRYTPEILSILREYGIHATFFVVGENVEFYPTVIGQILAGGHEIGNHTYDHNRVSGQPAKRIMEEIQRTESVVYELSDYRTKLFRPPEGTFNDRVVAVAVELDYQVILWNIDTRDWAHTPSEQIAENVLSHVKSGDIILMHDYIGCDSPTPDALRRIIPALLEEGYRFVSVSELIGSH